MPKGIVVSHKSVINFITHFIHTFQFAETDVIGNQAPFDFDVSVKDIYTCLMTGATLVIIPTKLFSVPPVLLDYLCNKHVNTLIWAVSALTLISALHGLKYRIPIEVKRVMFSRRSNAGKTAEAVAACTAGGGVCESVWTIGDYLQLHLLQGKKIFEVRDSACLGKPLTEEGYSYR